MKKIIILILPLLFITILFHGTTLASINDTYSYIIITTKDIVSHSSKLDDFIKHKQNLGYSVYVANEDDYEQMTGQPPNGRAEQILQWLIQNYIDVNMKQ